MLTTTVVSWIDNPRMSTRHPQCSLEIGFESMAVSHLPRPLLCVSEVEEKSTYSGAESSFECNIVKFLRRKNLSWNYPADESRCGDETAESLGL